VIKVVLDTSVFITALLSKNQTSAPVQILNYWRERGFTLIMAPLLMRELVVRLIQKNVPQRDIEKLVTLIAEIALYVPGAYEAICLDNITPEDNLFLAAAYESKADYIVSLDQKQILPLKNYHGTQILNPILFIRRLDFLRKSGERK
jgi:uncharacterized protein